MRTSVRLKRAGNVPGTISLDPSGTQIHNKCNPLEYCSGSPRLTGARKVRTWKHLHDVCYKCGGEDHYHTACPKARTAARREASSGIEKRNKERDGGKE